MMVILNNIILIGIFIGSLINLVIELDETRDTKYVVIAKLLFTTMAIGSVLAVVRPQVEYYIILNLSVLIGLIARIIRGLNRNKHKNT